MEPGAQEHDTQRALIFQGGGALGAYEAGVFKALCELLPKKDGKLFDIVAGTSAGAINSCLIVNHVVNTGDWHDAANETTDVAPLLADDVALARNEEAMVEGHHLVTAAPILPGFAP